MIDVEWKNRAPFSMAVSDSEPLELKSVSSTVPEIISCEGHARLNGWFSLANISF